MHLGLLGDHAGGEIGVRDQQNLARRRVCRDHLAHDAIGRDHRHPALHARHGAAVHEHHFRARPGAGGDDGGRHRPGRRVLLEYLQRLGAVRRVQLILQEHVLHLHAVKFAAQPLVLLVGIVQHDVVVQEAGGSSAQAFDDSGHRSHGRDRPDPDEAHVLIVLRRHRKQHQLRHDDQQQHSNIAVPVEQRLHGRLLCL